jgi:hypothetical protein
MRQRTAIAGRKHSTAPPSGSALANALYDNHRRGTFEGAHGSQQFPAIEMTVPCSEPVNAAMLHVSEIRHRSLS